MQEFDFFVCLVCASPSSRFAVFAVEGAVTRVAPSDRTHERRVCFKLRLHAARPAAHARGAERAPRVFRKGHDCPLLWMKLPPMVGKRRRFYKNENSRKRGERGVGKRQRWRSCCTYSNLYVYTRDGPHVTPRLTRGPASLDSHTSRNLTTLDSASIGQALPILGTA